MRERWWSCCLATMVSKPVDDPMKHTSFEYGAGLQPFWILRRVTWGAAPGWYEVAPWALNASTSKANRSKVRPTL